jgi:hypothetical protein
MNKGIFTINIFLIFFLIFSSINSASELESEKFKARSNEEGKADLIIEEMLFERDFFFEYYLNSIYVIVKNIGDASVTKKISVEGLLTVYLFGIIPSHDYHYHGYSYPEELKPSESVKIKIGDDAITGLFGFYRFECEVNPFLNVEEENYDNNRKL